MASNTVRGSLPNAAGAELCQRLLQHISQKANRDVLLDAFWFLMPDRPKLQIRQVASPSVSCI